MTEQDKRDALAWLDALTPTYECGAERAISTLKAMLAEPRMPYEVDADVLREIGALGYDQRVAIAYHARLHARLTKPATKEVWLVTVCRTSGIHQAQFDALDDALADVRKNAAGGATLTRHEVPV